MVVENNDGLDHFSDAPILSVRRGVTQRAVRKGHFGCVAQCAQVSEFGLELVHAWTAKAKMQLSS